MCLCVCRTHLGLFGSLVVYRLELHQSLPRHVPGQEKCMPRLGQLLSLKPGKMKGKIGKTVARDGVPA